MNKKVSRLIAQIETQIRNASVEFELLLNLFGTQDRLRIVNLSAPNVFITVHRCLINSVVIGLNRLCDPAVDRQKNKNLSLERLRDSLPKKAKANQELQKRLCQLEGQIKEEVKKLNRYRSKRIAHNDFESISRNRHKKVPNSSIDRALKLMEEFINQIYLKFDDASVSILNPQYPSKDGPDRLMRIIEKGTKCQQDAPHNSGPAVLRV